MDKKIMHFSAERGEDTQYLLELALLENDGTVDHCRIVKVGNVNEENLLETWKVLQKAVELLCEVKPDLVLR